MNLARSMALVTAAVIAVATGAVAQSPSASPDPGALPSVSPVPSATPFPWPTIAREHLAPGSFPEWPSGPATASTTDRGVRLELWLSTREAAPGDWVQAIVRATNLGRDTAWVRIGSECGTSTQTRVGIDLGPTIPMGIDQVGNAKVFKDGLLEHAFGDHFRSPPIAYGRRASGAIVRAFAECTNIHPRLLVEPVLPGRTRTERFIWRAARPATVGPRRRLLPLFPGRVPVTVSWAMAGRGPRPSQERLARPGRAIALSSSLELTGEGPGTPSYPELIDAALADPDLGAWIEANPFQQGWVAYREDLRGPIYNTHGFDFYHQALDGLAPNGVVELFVGHGTRVNSPSLDPRAAAWIDPWTGQLVATWFRDPVPGPSATPGASGGVAQGRLT